MSDSKSNPVPHEIKGIDVSKLRRNSLKHLSSILVGSEKGEDSMEDEYEITTKRHWATSDDKYWAIGEVVNVIPRGLYQAAYLDSIGLHFKSLHNNIDDIITLPDSESEALLSEIREFSTLKDAFSKHGFLYKRGILLWGPPGSGKTITIQELINLFTKEIDGIAIMCSNPTTTTALLRDFRKVEPNRQVLVVMEDIDALIDQYGEPEFLNMLDGEAQLQNVVYVATSNYPELLDKRFTDRPSRFDTIRRIGLPTEQARRVYLTAKMPGESQEVIEEFVSKTPDYSIAYLREIIVLTKCFGMSLEQGIKRLNFMRGNLPDSKNEGSRRGAGFLGE